MSRLCFRFRSEIVRVIDSTFGAAVAVRFQQDGTIDPADHKLAIELASPGFHLNKRNKLVIERDEDVCPVIRSRS